MTVSQLQQIYLQHSNFQTQSWDGVPVVLNSDNFDPNSTNRNPLELNVGFSPFLKEVVVE